MTILSFSPTSNNKGFTLVELLIVVAILAILIIVSLASLTKERTKAQDAKIKADLHSLKIAFENYYNDNNCYPPAAWFDDASDCESSNLSPYLKTLPCDPRTSMPFVLETDPTTCTWFKFYAQITNLGDPQYKNFYDQNNNLLGTYAVSSDNISLYNSSSNSSIVYDPNNPYYCQGIGNCSLTPPSLACSPSYPDPNCGNTNLCSSTVSTCVLR